LNCNYVLLEQEALLHIVGPDTLKFLQGQTTCDTRKVDPAHATPGAFCTPQGRVVCDFLLCELAPEHFALRMRRDIRDNSAAVFSKYIIFSKAKLDATREDWLPLGIWGAEAANAVAEIFGESPQERFGAYSTSDSLVVQMDEHGQQFECFLQQATSQNYLARMETLMNNGSSAQWQAEQITSGIARIEAATIGEFVPQLLNYDHTGHISFKKGCYTGQEVVARLHYLGKSKRRAYAAELPAQTECPPGTALYDAVSSQSIGNVINSCTFSDRTLLLVTATATGVDNGPLLGATDGPALTMLELPYTVEKA
jgi:tRNA-modifying protein YgfZ